MTPDGVHPFEMPDELDTFLEELRSAAATVPTPAPGAALATLFRDGAAPVATPSPARRWGLRIAVAGAVAGFGFGGLGVAGALPAPIQDRVADLAEQVGIDLPDGDDEPAKQAPVPTVPKSTTTTVSPSADAPGRTGDTPGLSGTTPGSRPESPGRSDTAPGRTGQTPAAEAPGRTGDTPAVDAPGRTGQTPAADAPGRTDEQPSATAPGRDDVEPKKDDDRAPGGELPAIAVRRNQTATGDVHLPDRSGRRPADDGGTFQ